MLKGPKYFLLCVVCVIQLPFFAQSTEKLSLKYYNDQAFKALENGDANADQLAQQFLTEALKNPPSKYLVNAFTLKGILFKNKGYYLSSLDYYSKALKFAKSQGDSRRISACYNNIATVYQLQNNYRKAIEYYNESLILEQKFGDQTQISIRYFNLGECYNDLDSLDLALSYYNSSLILEKKIKFNEGIVLAEQGIAAVYLKLEKFDDAEQLLSKNSVLVRSLNTEAKLKQSLLLSLLKSKKGNIKEAASLLDEALKLSDSKEFRVLKLKLLRTRIAIYKESKDEAQNLNRAYEEYITFLDWYDRYNAKNRLDDLSYRDELNKKQVLIDLAEQKKELAEKKRKEEYDLRVYSQKMVFFSIFLLVFILVMVIYGVRRIGKRREL